MVVMDVYSSPPGQGSPRGLRIAPKGAHRSTQIESMPLTRHSFKSSRPLSDIL